MGHQEDRLWGGRGDLILDYVPTGTEKKRGHKSLFLILKEIIKDTTSILCGLEEIERHFDAVNIVANVYH